MSESVHHPLAAPARRSGRRRPAPGFTLVEILMVLAVIAIMISLTIPLIGDYPEGRELASEADNVESQMAYARLIAVSSGAPVELRFYLEPVTDTGPGAGNEFFRATQVMVTNDEGLFRPDGRAQRFAGKTIILGDPVYSSVMAGEPEGPDPNARRMKNGAMAGKQYKTIRFLPDGSTNLGRGGNEKWFFTFAAWKPTYTGGPASVGPGTTFPNFVTLQVDPFTGKVRRYEPGR